MKKIFLKCNFWLLQIVFTAETFHGTDLKKRNDYHRHNEIYPMRNGFSALGIPRGIQLCEELCRCGGYNAGSISEAL